MLDEKLIEKDQWVTLTPQRIEAGNGGWLGILWVTKDLSLEGKLTVIESRFNPELKQTFYKNIGVSDSNVPNLKNKSFIARVFRNGNKPWRIAPETLAPVIVEQSMPKPIVTTKPTQGLTTLGDLIKQKLIDKSAKPVPVMPMLPVTKKVTIVKPSPLKPSVSSTSLSDAGKKGADTRVLKEIRAKCDVLVKRDFFKTNRPELYAKVIDFINLVNADLAK